MHTQDLKQNYKLSGEQTPGIKPYSEDATGK